MKKILSFDIDQTLNIAKTPITDEIAELLVNCLDHFEICPISGQKFDQFLVQIVNVLFDYSRHGYTGRGTPPEDLQKFPQRLQHLHLFVAQGTQYYRYVPSVKDPKTFNSALPEIPLASDSSEYSPANWELVYNYPLTDEEVEKITKTIETAAKELGYWEEDKLKDGDEIIENRLSQVTFSALGQKAGTEEKYAWDPDHKKREAIVKKCKEIAPEFDYEIGGTTSINAVTPGMNKEFGMNHLLEELNVKKEDILYFGDMTKPGGNDYPVVKMGIETITVRSHEDTAFALRGILGVL